MLLFFFVLTSRGPSGIACGDGDRPDLPSPVMRSSGDCGRRWPRHSPGRPCCVLFLCNDPQKIKPVLCFFLLRRAAPATGRRRRRSCRRQPVPLRSASREAVR
ncbi:hypothetical protein AAC387_Pa08g0371 [Persea americana]